MSGSRIAIEPLTPERFAPFGDLISVRDTPDMMINQGRCARFHDIARLATDEAGRIGISVFQSEPVRLPVTITLLERHPLGSQAFLPMSENPFLVVVAGDAGGRPDTPKAFVTAPGQGINILRNTWHAVLMPLDIAGTFAVVDRIGPGANVEEFHLPEPYVVAAPNAAGPQQA